LPIEVIEVPILMDVSELQSMNVESPMVVIELLSHTEARLAHDWNVLFPRWVTMEGMVTETSELHPSKAASPIHVTPVGIFIDERLPQYLNAPEPIDVIDGGRATRVSAQQS
jgi:hypothetical protein